MAKKSAITTTKLKVSDELKAVIKVSTVARTEAVKLVWDYIKKHKLQNPDNKRNIFADDKLKPIFGKKEITMFQLAGCLSDHLTK